MLHFGVVQFIQGILKVVPLLLFKKINYTSSSNNIFLVNLLVNRPERKFVLAMFTSHRTNGHYCPDECHERPDDEQESAHCAHQRTTTTA